MQRGLVGARAWRALKSFEILNLFRILTILRSIRSLIANQTQSKAKQINAMQRRAMLSQAM